MLELQTSGNISSLLLLPIVSSILCKHSPKTLWPFSVDTFSVNIKTHLHDPTRLTERRHLQISFATSIELAQKLKLSERVKET